MKKSIQNRHQILLKNMEESDNLFFRFCNKVYNSSWGIAALLAAISAWTAGILYV